MARKQPAGAAKPCRHRGQLRLASLALLVASAAAAGVPGLTWSRYDGTAGTSVPFSTGVASASGTSAAIDLATLPTPPSSVYQVVWPRQLAAGGNAISVNKRRVTGNARCWR